MIEVSIAYPIWTVIIWSAHLPAILFTRGVLLVLQGSMTLSCAGTAKVELFVFFISSSIQWLLIGSGLESLAGKIKSRSFTSSQSRMRSVIFFVILLGIAGSVYAQRRSENPRLPKSRPSVYITFERIAKIASPSNGELEETVWLRLRNNTRWSIILDMNGIPPEYGDAALFHDVLLDGKVIAEERCHVCSFNPLPPGRSLVFTVPRADLRQGHSIRVKFSYGWENGNDVAGGREVEHLVYFHHSSLPKTVSNHAVEQTLGSYSP